MKLTYEQNEWISKQYRRYLDGKLTLDKFNENLQKKFNTSIDFKATIEWCNRNNKGSSEIGWKLAEI